MDVLVEILLIIWNKHEDVNDIIGRLDSIITGIGFAMIGFLGFVVTGLAILTGAISSKIVKRLQVRKKLDALERILLSFYLLESVCAMAIYSYFTFFSIFYAVKLIGNCLELFILINEMEIVESERGRSDNLERRYYEYRVMALEKLNLSKVSANELTEYKEIISQLIKGDDTDKQTKTYYFYMLNKQFEDD